MTTIEDFMDHDPQDLLAILKALLCDGDIDPIIGDACCDLAANSELDSTALACLDAIIRVGIESRITAELASIQQDWGTVVASIDAPHLAATHSAEVFDALDRLLEPSALRVIADDALSYMSPLPAAVVSMELGARFAAALTATDDPDLWLQEAHAAAGALKVNSYPEGQLAVAVLAAAAHESLPMLDLTPESFTELHDWIEGICPDVDFHTSTDEDPIPVLAVVADSMQQPLRRVLLIAAAVEGVIARASTACLKDETPDHTDVAEALISEALADDSPLVPLSSLVSSTSTVHSDGEQLVEWIAVRKYAWAVMLRWYTGIDTAPDGAPLTGELVREMEGAFCIEGRLDDGLHPMTLPLIYGARTFLADPQMSLAQRLRLADESLQRIHAMNPEVADPALVADALAAIVHFAAGADSLLTEEQRGFLRQWSQVFSTIPFGFEPFGAQLQAVARAYDANTGEVVAAAACAHVALFGVIPDLPRSTSTP